MSRRGNLGACELLLGADADPASVRSPLRMTPLHAAAFAGHRAACVRLLEAGAPLGVRDGTGRTAMAWAKRRGQSDVVRALSSFVLPDTALLS